MKLENNNPSISIGGLEPQTNDHDVSSLDRDSGLDTGGAKEIVYLKGIRFVMLASLIGIMVFIRIGIAQWLGAEVFATVGYDDKKKLFMDRFGIPADHIFYSRNTSFAKGVMRMTNDYGVDVILNSLSGEELKARWECIAPYGRFVEIGKADIISNSSLPMSCFAKNKSFAAVDLVHILESRPKLITQMMKRLLDLLSQGIISGPDPLHIFGLPDVEKAFRLMQSGTNTGRIILNSSKDDLVQDFDPVASYIVAGGFGGIGRAILTWMVGRGAKNLIVPSRSGASTQAALAIIGELAGRGVRMMAPRCDAASSNDLTALLHNCTTDMPPIKGCINAAMVLQDSVSENMSYTQWSTTIQSKVATSWNLHSLLPQDMDFFIMLSSIAGVCGSPGQSHYAAGCSFQDALARYRSATGCRGSVSVDIGRMRNIGIIAETEEYRRKRNDGAHMYTVEEPDFFALLEHYCDPCLGVLHTDHSQRIFSRWERRRTTSSPRPLFAGFNAPHLHNGSGKNSAVSTQVDVAALFQQATTPAERSAIVVEAIAAKLARTLEVALEQIDLHDSLSHYGTDSLMVVELRNWIHRDFGVGVAVFEIMGGASIMAIGDLVARKADEE
ncbi:hypothetical protein PFICI_12664 [Pestalotiopsis fici W106-1]|uniref:Carrier domain-containing protein n=1 Tax=Pestalotiopsis fici (strain W106-1 / CGMCC3.15140) TaxID=1229662 RepID=W3WPB8_PESFW|nr:uncharacterized protein PFICI_12664 [Pestalotiopsis fici W106-1]ETS75720.1 hypothetical protein PFICI_12664 [Pestalotiopsis fici W106-1]